MQNNKCIFKKTKKIVYKCKYFIVTSFKGKVVNIKC